MLGYVPWIDLRELGRTYESSDANLCTGVTELGERSVEQSVLLPERLDIGIRMRLRGLECHICIGDLWDWRAGANTLAELMLESSRILDSQVEHNSEQEHKASDRQVDPLHVLKRSLVIAHMVEDSVRADDRRYDRSDSAITACQSQVL